MNGNWKRWVAGYDIHGVNQDRATNESFFRFVEAFKPHYRICGGDCWDFKQIRKKADPHERRDSMAQDVSEGKEWLKRFKPTIFLRGNHDERLWDLANQSEGIVADYAKLCVKQLEELITKLHCRMLAYNKREGVYEMGALRFIHGYITGITAARRTAMIYGNVVMGHGHGIQSATVEAIEPRSGFMCGCLCKVELEYNRAQAGTLSWENGWCYGVTNEKTGSFQYWQARRIDDKWILPTGIETL